MADSKLDFTSLLASDELIIMDGAMGTELQKLGLPLGERPERCNLERPDWVEQVHLSYLEAGSRIIYANTFGASAHKLSGSGLEPGTVIEAGIACARRAINQSGREALVALDIGPLGELLEPNGTLSFEAAYDDFAKQVQYGAAAGADLLVIETIADLYEAKAALLTAKENCSLPVILTMTFEADGRSFNGTTPLALSSLAQSLGADAVGINCSLGPEEIRPMLEELLADCPLPIVAKANAGLPDPATGVYSTGSRAFAEQMKELIRRGVQLIGGCCGTEPHYIAELVRETAGLKPGARAVEARCRIGSATKQLEIGPEPLVIGEQINPSGRKRLRRALESRDYSVIAELAVRQDDAGADILDINCGHPGIDEAEAMIQAVKAVQAVSMLPLQLDSADPEALEAGLRVVNGKPIVNSINGTARSLSAVLPLVKRYGAAAILLPLDDAGIPETAEGRLAVLRSILEQTDRAGIPRTDLIVDCLVMTASAEPSGPAVTLETGRLVRQELGLPCVIGLSNVSFGLPERPLLNRVFYAEALSHGITLAIINPEDQGMMETRAAWRALHQLDPGQQEYIGRFSRTAVADVVPVQDDPAATLRHAVRKGLAGLAGSSTVELLTGTPPLEIVNGILIPALDEVGRHYEEGSIFLPQLIQSANAAQAAFAKIRARMARSGDTVVEGPVIVLATVHGDIHDIGKNIVKVLLENYGYRIVDLGRDVPPQAVSDAVAREDAKLLGLSALMTTTLPAMAETIRQVNMACPDCRIMVGGAVLTADYAREIGADAYCADAQAGIYYAKDVFGSEEK